MKKLLQLIFLIMAGFIVSSCSDDEEMDVQTSVARDYQTDAQLLGKFVDVNKAIGEYYINENKKLSVISYITDKDWLEFQQINPINRTRFENELKALNSLLAVAAQDPSVSQIVFNTYGETYIKDIKHDSPVMLQESNPANISGARSSHGRLDLLYNSKQYQSFNAGRVINMSVSLNLQSYTYYFFTIKCNTSASKSPTGGTYGNDPQSVVMSGTTSSDRFSFTWTARSTSSQVYWDFEGVRNAPQLFSAQITAEFTD